MIKIVYRIMEKYLQMAINVLGNYAIAFL